MTTPEREEESRLERQCACGEFIRPGSLHAPCVPDLLVRLAAAEQERNEARTALADAANQINCSGPVAHRIRVLKREHCAQLTRLREARDKALADLGDACNEQLAERRKLAAALSRAEQAEREREGLIAAIRDIDAHATPYGTANDGTDNPQAYLVTVGALHRALGAAEGRATAAKCKTCRPSDETLERLREALRELCRVYSVEWSTGDAYQIAAWQRAAALLNEGEKK